MKLYKVFIANVTPYDCADWLTCTDIAGATITQGFGYWESALEPQCTVELTCTSHALQDFLGFVFEATDERAVYLVETEVNAQEVFREDILKYS